MLVFQNKTSLFTSIFSEEVSPDIVKDVCHKQLHFFVYIFKLVYSWSVSINFDFDELLQNNTKSIGKNGKLKRGFFLISVFAPLISIKLGNGCNQFSTGFFQLHAPLSPSRAFCLGRLTKLIILSGTTFISGRWG